ncbi:MAG: hypothetical protein CMG25_02470 [Candidatus Marinimicrobia bacterium]|nr:hypothetical protein [Candidatus Neomarinimicrobiota bacterium]
MSIEENAKKLSEIKETFQLLSDSLDMISYLIDIGKKSHNMSDQEKTNDNIISGCTSKAWIIVSQLCDDEYYIKTDSDSHIVSGLLYILCLSINNQSKDYISSINAIDILHSIGLDGKITSQRTNGFLSAVQTLKERIN